MIRSRFGLKALVLSGLLLGLMAFASSAQAETGATWKLAGAALGALQPKFEITEIENSSASLSFTTKGGTAVLILCTTAKFAEGGVMSGNGGISAGKILFSSCVVLLNEVAAPKCHPHSPGKGETSGEVLSEKGKGLIVLDKVEVAKEKFETFDLVKITPETGTLFAIIEMGETCAIGESVKVEAKAAGEGLWIKDINGNTGFLTEASEHLIVEGLNGLIALGQPAKIVGSAKIGLEGAHKGMNWSGKPA